MPDIPRYFSRVSASQYLLEKWGLKRSPRTLAKYASIGGGPDITYIGRNPYYSGYSLDEWVQSLTEPPVASTSARRRRGVDHA